MFRKTPVQIEKTIVTTKKGGAKAQVRIEKAMVKGGRSNRMKIRKMFDALCIEKRAHRE